MNDTTTNGGAENARSQPARFTKPEDVLLRKRVQSVAEATQHHLDLEEALTQAIEERNNANNRSGNVETANQILHEQIADLERKLEAGQRRLSYVEATLQNASVLLLQLLPQPARVTAAFAPGERSRLAAVAGEAERAQGEGEKLPSVVTKPLDPLPQG